MGWQGGHWCWVYRMLAIAEHTFCACYMLDAWSLRVADAPLLEGTPRVLSVDSFGRRLLIVCVLA